MRNMKKIKTTVVEVHDILRNADVAQWPKLKRPRLCDTLLKENVNFWVPHHCNLAMWAFFQLSDPTMVVDTKQI